MFTTRPGVRRLWLIGWVAILAAVSVPLIGQIWDRSVEIPRLGPSAITIVPGVHILGGMGPSAAYAVETPEGTVLIDAGLEADAGPLKAQLGTLGLDWRKTRAILLTHAHGDHTGGAEHLRRETGAAVHVGRGDAAVVRAGGPYEAIFSTFYMPNNPLHPTTVDVELAGGEILDFGGVRIEALATPGHTPGSVCYLLEQGGRRILFSGDVVMQLDEGQELGTYSTYLAPKYRGDAAEFLVTLGRLRNLPAPDLLLPGHPSWDEPLSPVMTPERWGSIIDQGVRDMRTLVARFRDDGADFLDGNPKVLLPGLDYLGDFQGSAVYELLAPGGPILVDAPGGPGLLEFVKARQTQLGREPSAPFAVLMTSCDDRATAGLRELVETCHPRVVVSPDGRAKIEELCPPGTEVLSPDAVSGELGLEATAIPLRGRGLAPSAYLVRWGDDAVLISGRLPVLFDHASLEALAADIAHDRERAIEYLNAVNRLGELAPDLWLPAVPSDGQNANLYDDEWARIIANNYRLGHAQMGYGP